MYRIWDNDKEGVEKAKAEGKIVVYRGGWDGSESTPYYDVFDTEQEAQAENERIARIDQEAREKWEAYLRSGDER